MGPAQSKATRPQPGQNQKYDFTGLSQNLQDLKVTNQDVGMCISFSIKTPTDGEVSVVREVPWLFTGKSAQWIVNNQPCSASNITGVHELEEQLRPYLNHPGTKTY